MNIKSYWNDPNAAMDSMVDPLGELVNLEFNIPKNFYQAKRLVILGEKLVIFILITLVMMCHVGETCPIPMIKAILILYFHRYQFLIKMVEDLKSVEARLY
ncbi:hypothetical protein H5410_040495 [Solanum commersonii]|uniref:Uncharacterized protein n=1 Tax=Solanum commersonii TaxID=4109 RepID=A0A9J5XQ96_SOLCO|nr:hypothetical protein H5410_040495 [Solanum commersonii]